MRVLFLDLDTLRPDHLGCYGYHRKTSPNIDSVAREGTTFSRYYCSDAPCLPSRSALMSGRFGIHNGAVGHGGTAADRRLEGRGRKMKTTESFASLPFAFRAAGMRTAIVSPFAERHSSYWFDEGFNEIYNTGKSGMESAEEITPTVIDWISRNAKQDNWYLHVNYWDAHTHYRAPAGFGDPFESVPLPEWITPELIEGHRRVVGPHSASELNMFDSKENPRFPRQPGEIKDMADARRLFDGYDCGIRYMDGHIGTLFEALREEGVFDDLAIIITADHGENMGELGIYAEHATADEATCRIPMIIRWPGCRKGAIDDNLHYNLDLAPTVAELLGTSPHPSWDGESYGETLRSGAARGRDYLVLSQMAHVCQRSVRFDDWLYVRTYHDGYHLFDRDMLFDLAGDPHEERNLARERPDVVQRAVTLYLDWHDEMMLGMEEPADPLWTVIAEGGPFHANGFLPLYCKRLEETGRAWAVEELKSRHPREFVFPKPIMSMEEMFRPRS
jgi:Arylsulfatase A and related enzymes